jgi:hypothetical protein
MGYMEDRQAFAGAWILFAVSGLDHATTEEISELGYLSGNRSKNGRVRKLE